MNLTSILVLVLLLIIVAMVSLSIVGLIDSYTLSVYKRIIESSEYIHVGVYPTSSYILVEISNEGSVSTNVTRFELRIHYIISVNTTNTIINMTGDLTIPVQVQTLLKPGERRYYLYNLFDYLPYNPSTITSLHTVSTEVLVQTSYGSYIFNNPSLDGVLLYIDRSDIGSGYSISVVGGEFQVKIYEYMYCSISSSIRRGYESFLTVDSTTVYIADSPSWNPSNVFRYNFGYDVDKTLVAIDTNSTFMEDYVITNCSLRSLTHTPLGGTIIGISRGLLILTQYPVGYDIAVYVMHNRMPELLGVYGQNIQVVGGYNATRYTTKIALSERDIDPLTFIANQIILDPRNNTIALAVGNYYSQAILIGETVFFKTSGVGEEMYVSTKFYYQYPILIILLPEANIIRLP